MERKSMMRRAIKNSFAMLSVVALLFGISLLCGIDDVYAVATNPFNADNMRFGSEYYGTFPKGTNQSMHWYKFQTSGSSAKYTLMGVYVDNNTTAGNDGVEVRLYDSQLNNVGDDTDDHSIWLSVPGRVGSLTFSNLKKNTTYYVGVQYGLDCYFTYKKYAVSVKQSIIKSAGTRPTGQVKILNTIANTGKRTNDVIWDKSKVRGATHYQINWRKRGASSWNSKTVGNTVRGTTSNLTIGGLYEIRVRPVKAETATTKVAYGVWSPTVYRYFHTTQKIRLKSSGIGSFTMSWARNSAASGYQVMYTTNKNGSGAAKNINSVGSGASSFTKRWLQSGRTYYVQVREIRRVGNINYIGNISVPVGVRLR